MPALTTTSLTYLDVSAMAGVGIHERMVCHGNIQGKETRASLRDAPSLMDALYLKPWNDRIQGALCPLHGQLENHGAHPMEGGTSARAENGISFLSHFIKPGGLALSPDCLMRGCWSLSSRDEDCAHVAALDPALFCSV